MAYASKQADMRRSLRSTFEHMWRSSHEFTQLGIGADSDILDLTNTNAVDLLQPPRRTSLGRRTIVLTRHYAHPHGYVFMPPIHYAPQEPLLGEGLLSSPAFCYIASPCAFILHIFCLHITHPTSHIDSCYSGHFIM